MEKKEPAKLFCFRTPTILKKKIEKLGFGRGVRERKFIRHNTLAVSTYEKVTGWLAVKI